MNRMKKSDTRKFLPGGLRPSKQKQSPRGVVKNFTKFTGKPLCQSLLFNKVTSLIPATSLKKRLWHKCFPMDFAKFSRKPFFIEHVWWLLMPPIEFPLVNFPGPTNFFSNISLNKD